MMNKQKAKRNKLARRSAKIRAKVSGTAERPRLSIFRSNKAMFAQIIDDDKGVTLVSAHTRELKADDLKEDKAERGTKEKACYVLGKSIAKKAAEKKVEAVVFDRGGNKYHGRVQAVAEGARDGGLKL